MIAIASEWFSGRNATGKISSISRPSTYSGNCGPGTLVTIRLNRRVEKFSRDACARIVGGAKFCAPAITSAPSACFDSLSPFIACVTKRRRCSGSAMYTGSGPRITTMRLPISPRSFSARTDTGTSARSSQPAVRRPREIKKVRRAPVTAAFVSASPPSEMTRRSPSSKPSPSPTTCSAIPAVNSTNPLSGPSIGRDRPASSTRCSSSSAPSRPATAPTAARTAPAGSSSRTSAATANVTARHAVAHRPSQCVSAERAGASTKSRSGSRARATPSGEQYITEPLPAETSGPRRSNTARAASGVPRLASSSASRVCVPTSEGPVASHARWRARTSLGPPGVKATTSRIGLLG